MQQPKVTKLELPNLKQARIAEFKDFYIFEARKGAGCITGPIFEKPQWTLESVTKKVKELYGARIIDRINKQ